MIFILNSKPWSKYLSARARESQDRVVDPSSGPDSSGADRNNQCATELHRSIARWENEGGATR